MRLIGIFVGAAAVVVCASTPAFAQSETIATAPVATTGAPPAMGAFGGAKVAAANDPTGAQIDAWLKADDTGVQRLDRPADDSGPAPRQMHGEVGATVSNRGYSGYGAASMPLGQASELDVAVAAGHERLPYGGTANPRAIAIGLYLDGGDVGRWLSRAHCNTPRWGVALPGDPQVRADGSCMKTETTAASDPKPSGHRRHGGGFGDAPDGPPALGTATPYSPSPAP